MAQDPKNITELLVGYGRGDKEAVDQLMPIVYDYLAHADRWRHTGEDD